MQPSRRKALKAMAAVGAAGLGLRSDPTEAGFMDDVISVSVKLQDEAGAPVAYAAVWRAIEYDKRHVRDSGQFQTLNVEDLWRVTRRYGPLSDIIARYGDEPVKGLHVVVMADANGSFADELNYRDETGEGNNFQRPDPLTFGYTFMKRGYLPGKVAFTLPRSERKATATVTLKRDPTQTVQPKPYLDTFDRIRHELSDTRRNVEMSEHNHQRLQRLREELEQAAQQAVAAGDNKAAARIYARMRYMPEMVVVGGRIAGWSQGDANTERAKRALARAYELDRDNLYVWMETYLQRMELPPNPTPEQRITAGLRELEKLIAVHGEAAWPEIYRARASRYALLGDYAKARQLYLEAAKLEPKFDDWNGVLEKMKREMKRSGVVVPADW